MERMETAGISASNALSSKSGLSALKRANKRIMPQIAWLRTLLLMVGCSLTEMDSFVYLCKLLYWYKINLIIVRVGALVNDQDRRPVK
jgi:hypothetical protein